MIIIGPNIIFIILTENDLNKNRECIKSTD